MVGVLVVCNHVPQSLLVLGFFFVFVLASLHLERRGRYSTPTPSSGTVRVPSLSSSQRARSAA